MVSEVNGPGSSAVSSAAQQSQKVEPIDAQPGRQATTAGPVGDAVSMTDTARVLQALDRVVAETPVVDSSRVESLREAIAAGAHEIDPDAIAEKLIELEAGHPDKGGSA